MESYFNKGAKSIKCMLYLFVVVVSFSFLGCSSDSKDKISILEDKEWISIENGTTGDAEDIFSGRQVGAYLELGLTDFELTLRKDKYNDYDKYYGTYKYDSPELVLAMENGGMAKYKISNKRMDLVGENVGGNVSFPNTLYLCKKGESTKEDDPIDILAGKTWKLSRLTTQGSSQRFLPDLWNDEKDYNSSMNALNNGNTFTLNLEGSELNTTFTARGISATVTGTWKADGKEHTISLNIEHTTGSESDPLAKAFIAGLQKIYKYEGNLSSLTLFYKDGDVIRVMGFF